MKRFKDYESQDHVWKDNIIHEYKIKGAWLCIRSSNGIYCNWLIASEECTNKDEVHEAHFEEKYLEKHNLGISNQFNFNYKVPLRILETCGTKKKTNHHTDILPKLKHWGFCYPQL